MNKSAISWTSKTWNPTLGCSRVTNGCKFCYAEKLATKRGWTEKPWTKQNEAENVMLKPHKLADAYSLDPGERVFVNSMSDLFHAAIPDWYRAVVFAIMLDQRENVFQVLTKRPENAVDWHTRYAAAIHTDEFRRFRNKQATRRGRWQQVYSALYNAPDSPWADHIWMGTSVEDKRVIHRIATLRDVPAHVRFISAEPLLGPYPKDTDLSGIHWVIVGGESGEHMEPNNGRWMKQEWARGIRDLCLDQGVAYFYKQDSAGRTEVRTALEHSDGDYYLWQQYPEQLTYPVFANASGSPVGIDGPKQTLWNQRVDKQRRIATPPDDNTPPKDPFNGMLTFEGDTAILHANGKLIPLPDDKEEVRRIFKREGMTIKHTVTIHTAQMGVTDPDMLDITIKSADHIAGKALAPTWQMVREHKAGTLSDASYRDMYRILLDARYHNDGAQETINRLLRDRTRIVLKCYCGAGKFCHRHLAAQWLKEIGETIDVRVIIEDEITRKPKSGAQQLALF